MAESATVAIANAPRDPTPLRKHIDVNFMLRVRKFVGWLFFGPGLLMTVILLLAAGIGIANGRIVGNPLPIWIWAIGAGDMIFGYLLLRSANRRSKRRLRALTHGVLCEAHVTANHRSVGWSIVMQGLDHRIRLEVVAPDGSVIPHVIVTPLPDVAQRLKLGSRTQALFDADTGAVLIPQQFAAIQLTQS